MLLALLLLTHGAFEPHTWTWDDAPFPSCVSGCQKVVTGPMAAAALEDLVSFLGSSQHGGAGRFQGEA